MIKIKPSEITPEHIYLSRRRFMRLGGLTLGSLALAACGAEGNFAAEATDTPDPTPTPTKTQAAATATPQSEVILPLSQTTDEMGNELTDYETVTSFNNFYEFSMDKRAVVPLAQDFEFNPWQVEVTGLVHKPQIFDLDDIRHSFTQQERIYRLRCVEAWSMVIPWMGFPLAELLKAVEPTSKAKYVRFRTAYESAEMPGTQGGRFAWPYIEGLRLDEAMHDLTILATGLYGKYLPPQNGAPVRLVVPWKYGFKSIKSIVRIDLVEEMPVSFWMSAAPTEYGFYANVNPDVDHPRWTQAGERRIGEGRKLIKTLMFNGYGEEVAHLYEGMDLVENF